MTIIAHTHVQTRDNLEAKANDHALTQSETALFAIAAGIYALICVVERIEDHIERIDDTLKARLDP
jgi:hypothetical protein